METSTESTIKPRKDLSIRVRVTNDQKAAFREVAEREGLEISAWLRRLGLQAVRKASERSTDRRTPE